MDPGTVNTIVNCYNRNFPKRNDGSANTLSFVTSPDTVIAMALAGRLDFNPVTDTLTTEDGEQVQARRARGHHPPRGRLRPGRGHLHAPAGRPLRHRGEGRPPPPTASSCSPPSSPGTATTTSSCRCCSRRYGKCTTDHISMAGPWLKYRGHLENISGNLFLGVINAFTESDGFGKDPIDGETKRFPEIAKHLHEAGVVLGGRRRRELRRGQLPRARRHGAPVPRRQGDPRAQLRPHPRDQPQEAGRPARSRSPTRRCTTRSRRTTSSRSSAWPSSRPASPSTPRSSSPTAPRSPSRPCTP